MPDLRCALKKHAILIPEMSVVEIKCSSKFCGAQRGTVILHRFDIHTGELVKTIEYREPTSTTPTEGARE